MLAVEFAPQRVMVSEVIPSRGPIRGTLDSLMAGLLRWQPKVQPPIAPLPLLLLLPTQPLLKMVVRALSLFLTAHRVEFHGRQRRGDLLHPFTMAGGRRCQRLPQRDASARGAGGTQRRQGGRDVRLLPAGPLLYAALRAAEARCKARARARATEEWHAASAEEAPTATAWLAARARKHPAEERRTPHERPAYHAYCSPPSAAAPPFL